MVIYSQRLARFLNRWPGKERFGIYRFLPAFVVIGASIEFAMINWRVGEVNFYSVYKRNQAHAIAVQRIEQLNRTAKNSISA